MTSIRIFLDYSGPRGCSTRFKWCKIFIALTDRGCERYRLF
jgi:hypothetical protein